MELILFPGAGWLAGMHRFRLIPGDACTATTDSDKVLFQETLPCSGHEQDSGVRIHTKVGTSHT
jgi:hypothetical protein